MTTFYVGQRVRLARPQHPRHMGMTGTVSAIFPERQGFSYIVNCEIIPDGPLVSGAVPETHTDRLEPILYDGNQLVSWSECAWKPEGVEA